MKYYVFPYSSDSNYISSVESSGRLKYAISAQNIPNPLADLQKDDILVGYCIGTQQGASFVLKVAAGISENKILAEKLFEIGDLHIVSSRYSQFSANDIHEISFEEYSALLNDFFSRMLPDKEITPQIASSDELPPVPKNLIFFGAPGTGKSHDLNDEAGKTFGKNVERVTFYPNYTYAQFVGTYKPVMRFDIQTQQEEITYAYVPGPFIRQWIKAQNTSGPVLLIIEELNRANAPAVFGDMFQLLDRKNGESEYAISIGEDLRKYLKSLLPQSGVSDDNRAEWEHLPAGLTVNEMKIPKNLYIWATMNSADQGVFPLDTAFKRRWDYKYFSAFDTKPIDNRKVKLVNGVFSWGKIRTAINEWLADKKVNEDKLMGPYFINEAVFDASDNGASFVAAFKDKVIMYLYEDAARQYRKDMFTSTDGKTPIYSKIIEEFDKKGTGIFQFAIDPADNESIDATNLQGRITQ